MKTKESSSLWVPSFHLLGISGSFSRGQLSQAEERRGFPEVAIHFSFHGTVISL